LIGEPQRWSGYIRDSLIETTVSRGILLLNRIDKPALLRRLFGLACEYSGQILSYQKMLGRLQDAGNTTTLAHYLDLLEGAGLAVGLAKYAPGPVRRRGSSPKLLALNTALMTAVRSADPHALRQDPCTWGRIVESAVGAHLVNTTRGRPIQVLYWLDRNRQVDFVLCQGDAIVALEVKSSARCQTLPGTEAFCRQFNVKRRLLVGGQGIPLEEFLSTPAGTGWNEPSPITPAGSGRSGPIRIGPGPAGVCRVGAASTKGATHASRAIRTVTQAGASLAFHAGGLNA
jgi:hypothetical protein